MSLEAIIIEFEIFYYQRFKTRPQLCRTINSGKTNKRSKKIISKKCSADPSTMQLESDLISCHGISLNNDSVPELGPETADGPLELTSWKEYQEIILQSANVGRVDVQWQDIKGADEVKELLKEAIVYPIKYPNLFTSAFEPWKSILIHGPPGTGKTSLAKAAATESNATFFNISSSLIINKWRGDTEKLIKVLFELAQRKAPSIIFIDEIDALALKRNNHEHEASRRMKSELFFGIDNLMRSKENVLVLATTNTPWDLDAAMLRRFEKRVYVPPPDEETRKLIFRHFFPKIINTSPRIRVDLDYDFLTKMTDKYTGSDIKNVCKNIKMTVIRELLSSFESNSTKRNDIILRKEVPQKILENILSKFEPTFIHSEDMYLNTG